jgi:hypothetical protein
MRKGLASETLRHASGQAVFAYQKKPNGSTLPKTAATVRASATTAGSLWLQCNMMRSTLGARRGASIPRVGEPEKFPLSSYTLKRMSKEGRLLEGDADGRAGKAGTS